MYLRLSVKSRVDNELETGKGVHHQNSYALTYIVYACTLILRHTDSEHHCQVGSNSFHILVAQDLNLGAESRYPE